MDTEPHHIGRWPSFSSFDVDDVVEYVSAAMTLRPGDVISTGTSDSVGIFRNPPDLLEPGDTVEAEIEGIGVLGNAVVDEPISDSLAR